MTARTPVSVLCPRRVSIAIAYVICHDYHGIPTAIAYAFQIPSLPINSLCPIRHWWLATSPFLAVTPF